MSQNSQLVYPHQHHHQPNRSLSKQESSTIENNNFNTNPMTASYSNNYNQNDNQPIGAEQVRMTVPSSPKYSNSNNNNYYPSSPTLSMPPEPQYSQSPSMSPPSPSYQPTNDMAIQQQNVMLQSQMMMMQQQQLAMASQNYAAAPKLVVMETDLPAPKLTVDLASPDRIAVAYRTKLSDSYKCYGFNPVALIQGILCCDISKLYDAVSCACICNVINWNTIKDRGYVEVHENRIESNYPSCGICGVKDHVSVVFFDKIGSEIIRVGNCSPFHLCWCLEVCGGVAAFAPMNCCNNCCCGCVRNYYPGLDRPDEFISAAKRAKDLFQQGRRIAPGGLAPKQMIMQ